MLKIKNNFRFLHCILAYLVSFYSASRGSSFGVYPIRIRPLTCVLRTLCIILYKVWHTLDHIEALLNTSGCILCANVLFRVRFGAYCIDKTAAGIGSLRNLLGKCNALLVSGSDPTVTLSYFSSYPRQDKTAFLCSVLS